MVWRSAEGPWLLCQDCGHLFQESLWSRLLGWRRKCLNCGSLRVIETVN